MGFRSAPEVRLDPLILPIRVKLADEEPAAGHQSPRRLRKHEIQILDVLQDEIAGDEIERTRFEGPRPRQIGDDVPNVDRGRFRSRPVDHGFRKIQAQDVRADPGEKRRVLAGPAADLENRPEAQPGQDRFGDGPVEIAGEVAVGIICVRPDLVRFARVEIACDRSRAFIRTAAFSPESGNRR